MEKYLFTNEKHSAIESLKTPFAIYQFINKRVVTLVLSDGFLKLFGYSDKAQAYDDMDNDMYRYTHPDDVARIANEAFRFATEGGKYEVIYRTRTKDDPVYKIIHATGEHVFTEDGVRLAHVWYTDEGTYVEDPLFSDAELTKKMSDELHKQTLLKASQYDYLTGLPRMTYFFEVAEVGKNVIESSGTRCAMLFIDFNGMKFFNSRYGFAEGDKLIKELARALVRIFNNENCCHIGGDHFAVYTGEDGLEKKLHQLFERARKFHNGRSIPVRVGIYVNDGENVPVSTAVDRAKYACDTMRDIYNSTFSYFKTDMLDKALLRQYVVSNIDHAIKNKWIHVYYQPIVRAINGRTCDEEALARWIDPKKGFLSPDDFIPFLEGAGILYKLDLYVLEQVLEKINKLKSLGISIVPQSINLSRSDFEACDMVEEIRKRVDAAGVSRKLISIEITESVIGSNFEYMKAQIMRFSKLGFPVWMDDFGSGYSSLDVLHEIPFDLIKFDMSFMKKLDKGAKVKVILTELMIMATALGLDTVCEGIETEEQVRFLQEIGCSKLQGFYFQKPMPLETIGPKDGFENPEEAEYYDAIGRINLYDLTFAATEYNNYMQNTFNTIPMCVIEEENDCVYYTRHNKAYKDFMSRFFSIDISDPNKAFSFNASERVSEFMKTIKDCCINEDRTLFFEERLNGAVVRSLSRLISVNPITGRSAIAIAILSVSETNDGATYAEIARALASDYYNIFFVDLDTEHFIEYTSRPGSNELALEQNGENFFETSRRSALTLIYKEDQEAFLTSFTKENIVRTIDEQGIYNIIYRLVEKGKPLYMSMKCTRMPDGNHIIFGVSSIDAQMKQRNQFDRLQRERDSMVRVMALSEEYLSLFTIDPVTNRYSEYSSSDAFESLGSAKEGDDFFKQALIDCEKYFYPEDIPAFKENFSKDNVIRDILNNGNYKIHYRLMIDGIPKQVSLLIAPFQDRDNERLVAGVRAWKDRNDKKNA